MRKNTRKTRRMKRRKSYKKGGATAAPPMSKTSTGGPGLPPDAEEFAKKMREDDNYSSIILLLELMYDALKQENQKVHQLTLKTLIEKIKNPLKGKGNEGPLSILDSYSNAIKDFLKAPEMTPGYFGSGGRFDKHLKHLKYLVRIDINPLVDKQKEIYTPGYAVDPSKKVTASSEQINKLIKEPRARSMEIQKKYNLDLYKKPKGKTYALHIFHVIKNIFDDVKFTILDKMNYLNAIKDDFPLRLDRNLYEKFKPSPTAEDLRDIRSFISDYSTLKNVSGRHFRAVDAGKKFNVAGRRGGKSKISRKSKRSKRLIKKSRKKVKA